MKKAYPQSGEQYPLCNDPVSSALHVPACNGAPRQEAIEVRPPGNMQPAQRGGRDAGQQEFFPLVSAAHEFKTPLAVMLGYTDVLRAGHLGPVNERQREVLGEIQEGAERLQKLIQDLLLLYELKAARDAPRPKASSETAEVNEHVREIFVYWEPTAKHKSIVYEFHPAPGNPAARIEPLKLEHIVSNLIENALKFTPAAGKVVVSVTPCFWERRRAQSEFLFNLERQANHKAENAVCIDVTDTGPGIPPGHHEDIFWDFVQIPGASSRGTGLGLAIARRLTEAHGGAIWVESEQGRGSKFSLLLAQAP